MIDKEKIRQLVKLPKTFDLELIDFDFGFGEKIYPLIPKEKVEELKESNPDIYENLAKAGVYYSLVLDIPKIKVHISNYGISQHDQGRAKNAPWWDVRDLGLSWIKKADKCLVKAFEEMCSAGIDTSEIPFFSEGNAFFDFWEMDRLFKISGSPDVYSKINHIIEDLWEMLSVSFTPCTAEELMKDPVLLKFIKNYLQNATMLEAQQSGSLLFLTQGIVVQYEELPWQKSMRIPAEILQMQGKRYQQKADFYLGKFWDYLRDNAEKFPCYSPEDFSPRVKIVRGKGGVYL